MHSGTLLMKYDAFWDIVDEYIQKKSATDDDRRHGCEVNGGTIVAIAIATSCADFYRQCVTIAALKKPLLKLP